MRCFEDSEKRSWCIDIRFGELEAIHDQHKLDLWKSLDNAGAMLEELLSDLPQFIRVLWTLIQPQAVGRNVDRAGFCNAIRGDSLAAAQQVFLDEVIDFFPSGRAREAMRAAIKKAKAIQDELAKDAMVSLDQISIEEAVAALRKSKTSGSKPAPSSAIGQPN